MRMVPVIALASRTEQTSRTAFGPLTPVAIRRRPDAEIIPEKPPSPTITHHPAIRDGVSTFFRILGAHNEASQTPVRKLPVRAARFGHCPNSDRTKHSGKDPAMGGIQRIPVDKTA